MTMLEYHMLKINQVLLAISCNGHFGMTWMVLPNAYVLQ
jgi:hypothetical protein